MNDNDYDLMNNLDMGSRSDLLQGNPYESTRDTSQENPYNNNESAQRITDSYVYTSDWMNTNSQQPVYRQPVQQPVYQQPVADQAQYTQYAGPANGGYYYVPAQYATPVLPKTENKGLAIAGMVCGILSIVLCCVTTDLAVPGLIMSIAAVAKKYKGRGMAIAGIICSSLGLILSLGFFGVLLLEMY